MPPGYIPSLVCQSHPMSSGTKDVRDYPTGRRSFFSAGDGDNGYPAGRTPEERQFDYRSCHIAWFPFHGLVCKPRPGPALTSQIRTPFSRTDCAMSGANRSMPATCKPITCAACSAINALRMNFIGAIDGDAAEADVSSADKLDMLTCRRDIVDAVTLCLRQLDRSLIQAYAHQQALGA